MIVRKHTSKQQENDNYMWKARDLKCVAFLISAPDSQWSDNYITTATQELDYVGSAVASEEFISNIHEVLRTRIEYMLLIMHKITVVRVFKFFFTFYSCINIWHQPSSPQQTNCSVSAIKLCPSCGIYRLWWKNSSCLSGQPDSLSAATPPRRRTEMRSTSLARKRTAVSSNWKPCLLIALDGAKCASLRWVCWLSACLERYSCLSHLFVFLFHWINSFLFFRTHLVALLSPPHSQIASHPATQPTPGTDNAYVSGSFCHLLWAKLAPLRWWTR